MLFWIPAILALLLLTAEAIVGIAHGLFRRKFVADVGTTAQIALAQPAIVVSSADFAGLPETVQRYFRYTGIEGKPRVRLVHLRHHGALRTQPGVASAPISGGVHKVGSKSPPAASTEVGAPTRIRPVMESNVQRMETADSRMAYLRRTLFSALSNIRSAAWNATNTGKSSRERADADQLPFC